MQVDYVKTWEVLPSVWVDDKSKYLDTNYRSGQTLDVAVNYRGGSHLTSIRQDSPSSALAAPCRL